MTGERARLLKRQKGVGVKAQGWGPSYEGKGSCAGEMETRQLDKQMAILVALRFPPVETRDYDFAVAPVYVHDHHFLWKH